MARLSEPSGDHHAVGVDTRSVPTLCLDDLRAGERDAFLRFYETYRTSIYNFVLRLMRGRGDAAAVTNEVFVTAYRQILLDESRFDLRPWLYGVAVSVCRDRRGDRDAGDSGREPDGDDGPRSGQRGASDLDRRAEQALSTLGDDHYTALLLNDVYGLRPEETAMVLGISTGEMGALLFRARERFLRAFEEPMTDQPGAPCRLAERVAASSVGRLLPVDEMRKLREHAAYCKPCRTTMKPWGEAAFGLALFLEEALLPEALQAAPIFGAATELGVAAGSSSPPVAIAGAASAAAAGAGTLARIRSVVASRAAAYAVAAVCLSAFIGLAAYAGQHHPQPVGQMTPSQVRVVIVPAPAASPDKSPAVGGSHPTVTEGPGATAATPDETVDWATSSRVVVTPQSPAGSGLIGFDASADGGSGSAAADRTLQTAIAAADDHRSMVSTAVRKQPGHGGSASVKQRQIHAKLHAAKKAARHQAKAIKTTKAANRHAAHHDAKIPKRSGQGHAAKPGKSGKPGKPGKSGKP